MNNTILIYGEIGTELDGNLIAQQINYLQDEPIDEIIIRINSVGGSIIQSWSIFSMMLASKKPIKCFIDGIAASCAGWICLASKDISMADFGLWMVHCPEMEIEDEKSFEILSLFKSAILKIFTNRTSYSLEQITKMMNEETWLDADECLKDGLINSIYTTNKKDMVDVKNNKNLKNLYKIMNKIITENMSEKENVNEAVKEAVTNALVDAVNDAELIETPSKNININIEKLVDQMDVKTESDESELKAELEALKMELESVKEKLSKSESELETINNKNINEFLNKASKAGKIKNESVSKWANLAKLDFNLVKETINSISIIQNPKKLTEISNSIESNERANWDYYDYMKKDSKALEKMKLETPDLYMDLYNRTFKK